MLIKKAIKIIKKYEIIKKGDKVVLAFSGGKDSVFLLKVLEDLSKKIKVDFKVLHLNLGIKGYSKKVEEFILSNFGNYPIEIINLREEYGFSLEDVVEIINKFHGKSVCGVCSVIKRYVFLKYTKEIKYNSIATAHTLDDFCRSILSTYLDGNLMSLTRMHPKTLSNIGIKVIKPIFLIKEEEIVKYLNKNNIPYFEEKCPYSKKDKSKYIKIINEMKDVEKEFCEKIVENFIKYIFPATFSYYYKKLNVKKCKECGMPTSRDTCLFCRIRKTLTR